MPFAPSRTSRPRRRFAAVVLLAFAWGCGGQARPAAGPAPAPGPRPATSVAAMQLAGQKVLVLPMQAASGVGQPRDAITREILFALGERDAATQWIDPERLRGVLRRYSALMDVRLVLIPQSAQWLPSADGTGGVVRITATMIDTRSSNVVWWGEADGVPAAEPGPAPVATAAAALAARMVVAR